MASPFKSPPTLKEAFGVKSTTDKLRGAMQDTFSDFRAPASGMAFGDQNRLANAGIYEPGSFGAQNAAANQTGFGMANAPGSVGSSDAPPAPTPFQALGDLYKNQLRNAGAAGVQAFAPTDLRQRAIAAGPEGSGNGAAFGTGDVVANAAPKAGGGYAFTLTQVQPGPQAAPQGPANASQTFLDTGMAPAQFGAINGPSVPSYDSAPQSPLASYFPNPVEPDNERQIAAQKAFPAIRDDYLKAQAQMADDTPQAPPPGIANNPALLGKYLQNQKLQADLSARKTNDAALGAAHAGGTGGEDTSALDSATNAKAMYVANGGKDLKHLAMFDKNIAAAQKQAATEASTQQKQAIAEDTKQGVIDNIDSALPLINRFTSGVVGTHLTGVSQDARDLKASLQAINSGLGVDFINSLRATAAANGSTGIGRLMQVEFEAAAKAKRNIQDQGQSPAQLKKNLMDLKDHLSTFRHLESAPGAVAAKASPASPAAPAAASQPPDGWTVKP